MLTILVNSEMVFDSEMFFVDQYYNTYAKGFRPWSAAMLEESVWLVDLAIADYAAILREPETSDRARRGERIILNAIERRRGLMPFA